MDSLNEEQKAAIAAQRATAEQKSADIFNTLDTDGNGVLDRNELIAASTSANALPDHTDEEVA